MVHFQFYMIYSAFSFASSAILDGYFTLGLPSLQKILAMLP